MKENFKIDRKIQSFWRALLHGYIFLNVGYTGISYCKNKKIPKTKSFDKYLQDNMGSNDNDNDMVDIN